MYLYYFNSVHYDHKWWSKLISVSFNLGEKNLSTFTFELVEEDHQTCFYIDREYFKHFKY